MEVKGKRHGKRKFSFKEPLGDLLLFPDQNKSHVAEDGDYYLKGMQTASALPQSSSTSSSATPLGFQLDLCTHAVLPLGNPDFFGK